MKLLSLECSTDLCSVALLSGDDPVHELFWDSKGPAGSTARAHHESMIDLVDRARAEAGWRWNDIECFVAGRGPGNYSGLRAALLTVQALAAPARAPVHAVGSMDALALALIEQQDLGTVTIIGDARRQSCWIATCAASTIRHEPVVWATLSRDEIAKNLPSAEALATPHWNEMAWLRETSPGHRWIAESQRPTAVQVARLALARAAFANAPEPAVPIYAHPAV